MGRGRGKGRKLTASNNEDSLSGEDDKIPVQKRRGRPQKLLPKEEETEEAAESETIKTEEGDEEHTNKSEAASDSNAKRKHYNTQMKNTDEEDGTEKRSRQTGNRRKSTPRRAAEAGVEFR